MINYDYRSYFYSTKHKKDILIVNYSATVNIVPGEPPSAPGALFQIKTKDLVLETFDLEESLCSEDNLKFGLSESARLSFSIVDSASIPNLKSDDETRRIKVYIYFDGDSSTLLQVGEYICDKDELTSDRKRRDIECYDALYYLRDLDIAPWYYDVYANNNDAEGISIQNLRWSLFSWILNNSEYPVLASQATLINDDYKIPKTIESDTITFDFFMQGILEINGVFGHIGRTGLFEFKSIEWYSTPSVATLYNQHHKPFVKYEDFITWSIGYVVVYDKNNIRIGKEGSSAQAHPSNYKIYDSFVFGKIVDESKFRLALQKLRSKITNLRYRPFDTKCIGELSLEVGDKIEIQYNDSTRRPKTFYTYVLERHITGFGVMTDSISAKGDKKQPKRKLDNSNWHSGDSENSTSGEGTGGISTITNLNANEMIEYWRNIGIRLLDEPSDVSALYQRENGSHWVELYWTDPSDITTKRPEKCEWLGTVVVRKENEAPKHRWDGELIVNSTTRNQYSETPFVDDTIDVNKKYFYGIFPYHRHLTDADNDVNFYRFTKVVSVNTEMYLIAPEITNLSVDVITVTMTYNVPALSYGSYTDCRLVYKKNGIPNTLDDGTVVTLNPSQTSVTVTGLDISSVYFFMIFVEDSDGNTASSDAKSIKTGQPHLVDFFDMALSTDMDNAVNCGTGPTSAQWESTNILFWGQYSKQKPTISNHIIHYEAARDYTASSVSFPLKKSYDILGCYVKMNFIAKSQDAYHDQWILAESYVRGSSEGKYRRVQYAYDNTQYPEADVFVDETGIYEFNKMFDAVYHQNRFEIGFGYGTWEILELKLWVLESD